MTFAPLLGSTVLYRRRARPGLGGLGLHIRLSLASLIEIILRNVVRRCEDQVLDEPTFDPSQGCLAHKKTSTPLGSP